MNVSITGASGFLGHRLAMKLLHRGTLAGPDGRAQPIDRLTLVDVVPSDIQDPRVVSIAGDIADADVLRRAVGDSASIFHLAAVVSGAAEADFDLGMRINVDATRSLLEICRAGGRCPRVVFTSSVAVYGGKLPDSVPDDAVLNPQTSYGTQKAIGELLINDYSRRRFVDGRSFRLPTISVRPGRPNAAASSFASGIIREPLNGEEAVCPVDPATRMWLLSPAAVIDCLIAGHELPAEAFGSDRALSLPGISVPVGEMVGALERVAGKEVAARVRWQRDPRIAPMVATWPGACDATRARALGFPSDPDFDTIVRRYISEDLPVARQRS